jgi:myo-inositol catabolism protein IolH
VKIALDPYMIRSTPLLELPGVVAELGYEWIELSPREDFMPFFLHPRADDATVQAFKRGLDAAGVGIASMLPLYRWSGPEEDERAAAVRYWRRAIQISVDLGCAVMNSEFNGRPEQASRSEGMFWKSMEELLPVFEREGVALRLEPHPDDFVEDGVTAVNMIRGINSPLVSFLYCAPHTFHQGGNLAQIMEHAGPLLTQVHVADSFDHRGSSGLRYIVNPPGSTARIHQHLDIGQGEVDWDAFFTTLNAIGFGDRDDTIMTACVFAWEERAHDSSRYQRPPGVVQGQGLARAVTGRPVVGERVTCVVQSHSVVAAAVGEVAELTWTCATRVVMPRAAKSPDDQRRCAAASSCWPRWVSALPRPWWACAWPSGSAARWVASKALRCAVAHCRQWPLRPK